MARAGNVRYAQAHAKQWNRRMRDVECNEEQRAVRGKYMATFNNCYNNMNQQEEFI